MLKNFHLAVGSSPGIPQIRAALLCLPAIDGRKGLVVAGKVWSSANPWPNVNESPRKISSGGDLGSGVRSPKGPVLDGALKSGEYW